MKALIRNNSSLSIDNEQNNLKSDKDNSMREEKRYSQVYTVGTTKNLTNKL